MRQRSSAQGGSAARRRPQRVAAPKTSPPACRQPLHPFRVAPRPLRPRSARCDAELARQQPPERLAGATAAQLHLHSPQALLHSLGDLD